MDKIAVVVVETYSAKLVIANVVQDNYFSICDVEVEPIKFGLEMDDDHFLKKNQIMSIISTLKNFRKICDMFAVTKTIAIATFVKDTKPMNIYSFFDEVFVTCGFRFTLLSPEEANNAIYTGIMNSYDIAKGFIKINSIEINNSTPGINDHAFWHGEYFNNIPITLAAVPMPGYKFSYWEKDGKKVDSLIEFTVSLHEDSSFKAFFEFDYASIAGIEKVDFLIYPNPVVDKVTIASYSDSPISYSLFNKAGQLMNKGIIYSNELNISEFNKGVYYIELIQDNKRSYKKILKL